jgi:hypothetical protein
MDAREGATVATEVVDAMPAIEKLGRRADESSCAACGAWLCDAGRWCWLGVP